MDKFRLPPNKLSRKCDPELLGFKDTSEIKTSSTIHGQPRGVRAIEFGVEIESPGYNIYVLGPTGSDRVADVCQFALEYSKRLRTPDDWCYVFNFKQPHRPRTLRLSAGMGQQLKNDMQELINALQVQIPAVFE
ncbi:MAG: AAA family ATPase, partial [Anaerolineae bacterium]|nr:AAA family ATPase [Anaerolineae bacterium]